MAPARRLDCIRLRGTRHSNGGPPALLALPLLAALAACGGRTGLPSDDTLVVALESIAVHDSRLSGVDAMNPTADFSFLPGLARR